MRFFSCLLATLGCLLATLGVALVARAAETATATGSIKGGSALLNPVWMEAKDEKHHRYSFRQPSATVPPEARRLTAYLPKELAIVALSAGGTGAKPASTPFKVHVSGGRTTPVTIVVAPGTKIEFTNHDPFMHRIHSPDDKTGFGPSELESTKTRVWAPTTPGKYEIRDEVSPSLRSWVVVEPNAAAVAYPSFKNTFKLEGLAEGKYTLRGYFSGEQVGDPLAFEVPGGRKDVELRDPLVVGKPDEKKED